MSIQPAKAYEDESVMGLVLIDNGQWPSTDMSGKGLEQPLISSIHVHQIPL